MTFPFLGCNVHPMPRKARIVLAGHPHHIIQRGHNRQTVFVGDDDYRYYLANLGEWKIELGCKVYAYCLMANHVHLIVNPGDNIENIGRLMKRIAGRQTRYVNKKEHRSGTLWDGRYHSSPIDTEEYLLTCCRYVETAPVRAGVVLDPKAYPWSSCSAKTGLREQMWLDMDSCYLGLGDSPVERQQRYDRRLQDPISDDELLLITEGIQRGQLTGSSKFVSEISAQLDRPLQPRRPGRPKTKSIVVEI